MKTDLVTTETIGHVGLMRFNNPEEMNTLHVPMLQAMEEALTELERDADVRVIIITGVNDKAFIAGGNIKDLNSRRGLQHYNEFLEMVHRVFRRFEICTQRSGSTNLNSEISENSVDIATTGMVRQTGVFQG